MTEIENLAFQLVDAIEAELKARTDYFNDDIDGDTYTPLHKACENKDRIITRLTNLRKTIS